MQAGDGGALGDVAFDRRGGDGAAAVAQGGAGEGASVENGGL